MRPKVESLHLNFQTNTATAVVVFPVATRDNRGDFPPILEHLELFIEMWCGLQGETLSLRQDGEGYSCVCLMSTDRAGKAHRFEVQFDLVAAPTRAQVNSIRWEELQ